MQKLFNKILVPVDFSTRSKKAIEKAVEMADEYGCSISLLHVVSVSPFATVSLSDGHMVIPYNVIDNQKELEFKLKKFERLADVLSKNNIEVSSSVIKGSWDEAIIEFAVQNNIDLIVIAQKSTAFGKRKMLLNPDKIAAKTSKPVISIPINKRITKLFTIVIPITDFLPVKKLMYGIYIASKNNATIKLLSIENEKTKESNQYYLKKAYQLIRDNCNIKTEMETIRSNNTAEAVNEYAVINAADLVIVNPGTQTRMPGILSSFLGNIIQKYAAPPILTITPL